MMKLTEALYSTEFLRLQVHLQEAFFAGGFW